MNLSEVNMHIPQGDDISTWVDAYLRGIGDNEALADGLLKDQRFWVGPFILPITISNRCCGPEEGMEYPLSVESFNETVERVIGYFKDGNKMEPFICQFKDGELTVRDGTHRHEALKRLGIFTYWMIIWCDTESDMNSFLDYIDSHLSLKKRGGLDT